MKLAFLVWFIDFIGTADFFSIADSLMLIVLVWGLMAIMYFVLYSMQADNLSSDSEVSYSVQKEALSQQYIDKYINTKKYALVLFGIGVLGTLLNGLIPNNKDTLYLMAGAYITEAAYDNCQVKDTICNQVQEKLKSKIVKSLENMDAEATIEQAIDKAGEVATKAVVEKVVETAPK